MKILMISSKTRKGLARLAPMILSIRLSTSTSTLKLRVNSGRKETAFQEVTRKKLLKKRL